MSEEAKAQELEEQATDTAAYGTNAEEAARDWERAARIREQLGDDRWLFAEEVTHDPKRRRASYCEGARQYYEAAHDLSHAATVLAQAGQTDKAEALRRRAGKLWKKALKTYIACVADPRLEEGDFSRATVRTYEGILRACVESGDEEEAERTRAKLDLMRRARENAKEEAKKLLEQQGG